MEMVSQNLPAVEVNRVTEADNAAYWQRELQLLETDVMALEPARNEAERILLSCVRADLLRVRQLKQPTYEELACSLAYIFALRTYRIYGRRPL